MSLDHTQAQWVLIVIAVLLFGLGSLVLFSLALFNKGTDQFLDIRNLFRVQFMIIALVGLPSFFGGHVLVATLGLFWARGVWELNEILKPDDHASVINLYGLGCVTLVLFMGLSFSSLIWHPFLWIAAMFILSFRHMNIRLIMGLFVLSTGVAALFLLGQEDGHFLLIGLAYILVESFDSFAYLIGRIWGGVKLFPKLSPGKTLEGYLGGLIGALGTAVALNIFIYKMAWPFFMALCFVILVFGFCGDLIVSAFKRACARKDFAPLSRLHGGILDIYDSLLFGAMALCLIYFIFGHAA
ncbi:phosphatidate cytidylyltransferase [Rhodospirillales bacterium]|nr:phosphatidate cytidylyltransferase [Rhodospirillales bacterium]